MSNISNKGNMPIINKKKYDLGKYETKKETKDEIESNTIYPSFETTETRMLKGEKPIYKRTQKDLDECQIIMSGAVQLMYDRLMGKTEFDISERQYNQFLVDAREETKLFTWGFITLDELAEWVFDSINVELAE